MINDQDLSQFDIYKELLDTATEVIWLVSYPDFKLLYLNSRQTQDLFGLDPQLFESDNEHWIKVIHSEERDSIAQELSHFLKSEDSLLDLKYRIVKPNGEIRWVRNRTSKIFNASQELIRIQGKIFDITEKVKKEELLEDIQKVGVIGGWELNPLTMQTRWTEETYRIHEIDPGVPTNVISGISFYSAQDRPRMQSYVEKCIEGKSYDDVFEFTDAKGVKKWVRASGQPIFDAHGKVVLVKGIIQDVSTSERAVRLNRNLINAIQSSSFFVRFNDQGKILEVNSSFLEFLGVESSEINVISLEDLLVDSESISTLSKDISLYGSWRGKLELRSKKNENLWIDATLTWVESAQGENQFIGIGRDITFEHKTNILNKLISNFRSQFIKGELSYPEFFNNLLVEILHLTKSQYGFVGEIIDDYGKKVLRTFAISNISWDKASKEYYEQYKESGFIFSNLNTLFGEVIKTEKPLITNNAPMHPKRAGTPPGHPALHSFAGIPLFYGDKMIGMIGLANGQDGFSKNFLETWSPLIDSISEFLHAIKLHQEIDKQRKISEHQARLVSIGELASGVGHEINNPLAICKGHIELFRLSLSKENLDLELLNQSLNKIENSLDRISKITSGLRVFSQSEDQGHAQISVREFILESMAILKQIYQTDGINLRFYDETSEDIFIFGHKDGLNQVLINLLKNSKDAVDKNRNQDIHLYLRSRENEVEIEIRDFGLGISPEILPRIFDPFFTTKDIKKGVGIGLSIAHGIIKSHKGVITVKSVMDEGTSFFIKLPHLKS
jgi:PAS domain S-box-containing protein